MWCGARNGRSVSSPPPPRRPAIDWMRVTSIASSGVSGGRIDGRRRASIVLPVPGGPCRSRLWPPAAATSSAAISALWPRTSARSAPLRPARAPGPRGRQRRRRLGARAGRPPPRRATRSRGPRCPATSAASRARERGTTSRPAPWRARALGHRERAADRAHVARQRQLADDRARLERRPARAARRPRAARPRAAGRTPGPTLRR